MLRPHSKIVLEIQGLRAIAVLAVLVYHIWPQILPGGYVGVDVFFVISGYLITGSLFNEFEATGRIGILAFYGRRIRRLLPAATLVCLAIALSIPLFPKAHWADIASGIVASALYVQNWFLAAQAVDYLADDAKGPLNHFWSLSVEEQYYIVWPLLLWPILHFARRGALNSRSAFGWLVVVIGVGSLAHSVVLTSLDPGLAYFSTATRAWELALGGALAVFLGKWALPDRIRAGAGLAGICAIGLACLAYSENTPFPGYAALLPTLGAAAVIVSRGSQTWWSARRLLSSRISQYFGNISYSLYLWHWPLIVLYGELTGHGIGMLDGAAIFLASCALAHVSKTLVEDYFLKTDFPLGRTLATGAACIAVTVSAGFSYLIWDARERQPAAGQVALRGADAMRDPRYDWRNEDLSRVVPRPETAKKDIPSVYATGCHQSQRATKVLTCNYGNPDSKFRIVMIGDSHAGHLYPALGEIARKRSLYFQGISKSACLFSLEAIYYSPLKRPYSECLDWSRGVIEWLGREKPNIVLISQSPNYPSTARDGMAAAWTRLIEMGLDVRVIRSTPWLRFEPEICLARSKNWVNDCAPSRSSVFKPDLVQATAETLKLNVLDLSESLCDSAYCPIVLGGVLVYRDKHHFTETFAKTLSTAIEEQLLLRSSD